MSNQVYVRTDKNGTKIYHDYTCQRCGGLGASEAWKFTGMTCYECGGSGVSKARIIREYTPEYAAKLAAKREARWAKQQEELRAKSDKLNAELLAEYFPEGKIYFLGVEDRFINKIRDELQNAGVETLGTTGLYYFTKRPEQFPVVEVTPEEALYTNVNTGIKDFAWELWKIVDAKIKALKPVSQWVGNIGEKISEKALYERCGWYETKSFRGWRTETMYVHTFRTQSGNLLVWKTSKGDIGAEEGSWIELTGTVKEHSEYKGDKQTLLTRCKILQG